MTKTQTNLNPTAVTVSNTDGTISVQVMFIDAGVDRPQCYSVRLSNHKVAARLAAAVDAGAVMYDAEIRTDVNGKTYVSASSRVLGRTANADLKRLGW